MYQSFKRIANVSVNHRNHRAAANTNRNSVRCSYIHGYSRTIELTFECDVLTNEGWVVDFGDVSFVKRFIHENWDHATVIAFDDPLKDEMLAMEKQCLIKLFILPPQYPGSIEGNCKFLLEWINKNAPEDWVRREARCVSVRIYEHSDNFAQYSI